MENGTLYGMVTVGSSANYTRLALQTFFKHTKLEALDSFVLIDNDGLWDNQLFSMPFGRTIVNSQPLNFSGNVNQLIALASSQNQNLVFLSNDVVFTPRWSERLKVDDDVISLPSCNQTHYYGFNSVCNINEFNNQFGKLNSAAHLHSVNNPTSFETLLMPFYVFRLSQKIYTTVGLFDTEFHMGGEDVDYRLRALSHGFDVKYTSSFLLHFNGASTWNGVEDAEAVALRNMRYTQRFEQKWGTQLTNLCIHHAHDSVIEEEHRALRDQGMWNRLLRTKSPRVVPQIK